MEEEVFIETQPSMSQSCNRLQFQFFYTAFSKTHSHGNSESGEKLSKNVLFNATIFHTYTNAFLFSFMVALNVEQMNTSLLNLTTFSSLPLIENAISFKYQISTQKDVFPLLHMIIPIFLLSLTLEICYFQTLLNHCITKLGTPQNLVPDRGTEYINQDKTHLCPFNINSPRTPYAPWANSLVVANSFSWHLTFSNFTKLFFSDRSF